MKKNLKYKKIIIGAIIAAVFLAAIIFIIILFTSHNNITTNNNQVREAAFLGIVINDDVKIPDTKNIAPNAGEIVARGDYAVKLQPTSEEEEVLVTKAKLTLKEAYSTAEASARAWSSDARLAFINSNGALGLDGRSSSWQIVFNSQRIASGYEIIITEDKIVSSKQVTSESEGNEPPVNWYDSNEAIASLSTMPQFSDEYLSALTFYYSVSAESWAYALALTDNKTVSMWVK